MTLAYPVGQASLVTPAVRACLDPKASRVTKATQVVMACQVWPVSRARRVSMVVQVDRVCPVTAVDSAKLEPRVTPARQVRELAHI